MAHADRMKGRAVRSTTDEDQSDSQIDPRLRGARPRAKAGKERTVFTDEASTHRPARSAGQKARTTINALFNELPSSLGNDNHTVATGTPNIRKPNPRPSATNNPELSVVADSTGLRPGREAAQNPQRRHTFAQKHVQPVPRSLKTTARNGAKSQANPVRHNEPVHDDEITLVSAFEANFSKSLAERSSQSSQQKSISAPGSASRRRRGTLNDHDTSMLQQEMPEWRMDNFHGSDVLPWQ